MKKVIECILMCIIAGFLGYILYYLTDFQEHTNSRLDKLQHDVSSIKSDLDNWFYIINE